jgi:hypothetical protein
VSGPPYRRAIAEDPAARRVGPCPVGRPQKEPRTVNKVLLAGRLTRDPEMRALASGKHVTQFSVATTEYAGNGKERPEYHHIVTWVSRMVSRKVPAAATTELARPAVT